MAYSVKIQIKADHLLVQIEGNRVPGKIATHMINAWQQVAEECHITGIHKVLAIINLTGRVNIQEGYAISSDPSKFKWERYFKLAAVDLNEDSYRDNLFTEVVARDRGYQVKVCKSLNEAKSWLFNELVESN